MLHIPKIDEDVNDFVAINLANLLEKNKILEKLLNRFSSGVVRKI